MINQRFTVRQLYVFTAVLILIVSSIGVASRHRKKKQAMPTGHPVLWQQPTDIGSRNLFWGQGGKAMYPDLRRVTLIEKEKGGYSRKYRVRDGSGREWIVKVGKEAKAETAAARLLWSMGYFSDVNYLVPRVYVEGLNKMLENARFSARPNNVKRIDGWKWSDNPFRGKREFQGLKVMMALINNWDIKDSNNKVLVAKDGKGELHYEVGDLGGTFGKVSHIPRFLQFKPDRNNPKAYSQSHLVDKVKDGRVHLHFSVKRSSLFKDISPADADWIASKLSRLSERQIADAFRAANYSPVEVRMMTQGVRKRIDELREVRKSMIASRSGH